MIAFTHDDYFMKEMNEWPIHLDRIVNQNHLKQMVHTLRARAQKALHLPPTRQPLAFQGGSVRGRAPQFFFVALGQV